MRIGLFGQFGSGNLGNDGSLESILILLRKNRPAEDLVCICPGTTAVEDKFGIPAISITGTAAESPFFASLNRICFGAPGRVRNILRCFRLTRNLDAMVIPGTGILDDFCETPFGWPYVILRWCLAARWNGVPIYFVSIGAGPARHFLSRIFLTAAARLAAFRSYRDHLSLEFIAAAGIDTSNDVVNSDLAFLLPPPTITPGLDPRPLSVGVGVMNYTGWSKTSAAAGEIYETYIRKMRDFIAWLLSRGFSVRLFTGSAADDRAVADLLKSFSTSSGMITAKPADSLHALMDEMALTDIVVATRYHNVVCALSVGRPTISLSYAGKNDELLTRVGLGEYCNDVETFEPLALRRQVDAMIEQRHLLGPRIQSEVKRFRIELEEQAQTLSRHLNSSGAASADMSLTSVPHDPYRGGVS